MSLQAHLVVRWPFNWPGIPPEKSVDLGKGSVVCPSCKGCKNGCDTCKCCGVCAKCGRYAIGFAPQPVHETTEGFPGWWKDPDPMTACAANVTGHVFAAQLH